MASELAQPTSRLFLGLGIPPATTSELLELEQEIAGARWQTAEQLHLTLHFLGNQPESLVGPLIAALQGLKFAAFDLQVNGAGCYVNQRSPSILWAGVSACEGLWVLHRQTADCLGRLGLPSESRPWRPHVTLARLPRRAKAPQGFIEAHARMHLPAFNVREFCLYQSHATPAGSRYQVLQRFAATAPD